MESFENLVSAVVKLLGEWKLLVEVLAHTHELGPLAGEDEGASNVWWAFEEWDLGGRGWL